MVRASIRAGVILAALLGASAQAAAPQVPAAAFAALPQISGVELSPDGKLLAWRDQSVPVTKVVIYDIDSKSYRRTLDIDPSMTLLRVDTRTGKGTPIEQGDRYTAEWVVNADGAPVVRSEWRPEQKQYYIEAKSGAGWRQILERKDGQAFTLYGLNVAAPVLLLHATDDTYVPFSQSQLMANALASLGKPVALVKLQGDDHWLSKAATRLEVLQDTDRFLRQYLK